jgi:phosphomevalonate kinase
MSELRTSAPGGKLVMGLLGDTNFSSFMIKLLRAVIERL